MVSVRIEFTDPAFGEVNRKILYDGGQFVSELARGRDVFMRSVLVIFAV